MKLKVDRQIQAEDGLRKMADARGVDVVADALIHGRYPDLPAGRVLIAKAYADCLAELKAFLVSPSKGLAGKYRTMLRRVPPETAVLVGLRLMLHACSDDGAKSASRLQALLREIGQALEAEAMVRAIEEIAPAYLKRTLAYLDAGKTTDIEHRRRTFLAAAEHTMLGWNVWTSAEREGTARLLMEILWQTGLFVWEDIPSRGTPAKHLAPSPVLAEHFEEILENTSPILRFEPMVCEPEPWTAYGAGGYLTAWMRTKAPMVALRRIPREHRDWVLEQLPNAKTVLSAMNRAQAVPYRINRDVLALLRKALGVESGVLGLPSHGEARKPPFPFNNEWKKDNATEVELENFQLWKAQTAAWHADEAKRVSKKRSIASAARLMQRYVDEPELYFVTYVDSRGRLYFRGNVHPQSHDSTKACLEFANGKRLGAEGLAWLKVHVANCAGFDKADYPERMRWTDENWDSICAWLDEPFAAPAPDPDSSFSFYAAGMELRRALQLPRPDEYITHLPCAQDATCSGLQHFSALFRDEVGGACVNLIDSGGKEKADVYMAVAKAAQARLTSDDANIAHFWQQHPITRDMAKRPVMTFVYGSTLTSSMDYVATGMAAAGIQPIAEGGTVLYSLLKLSVPVAKALRYGVEQTVPKAAAGMRYLQEWARRSAGALRWVTPAGMPVVNWAEGSELVRVEIRSMGVRSVLMARDTGKYKGDSAADAIAPNFVHSLDSAHLCMVLHEAPFDVVPIHDSFGALACDTPHLHAILRSTFVELYQTDPLQQLEATPLREGAEIPVRPAAGNLDLRAVLRSRFVFC